MPIITVESSVLLREKQRTPVLCSLIETAERALEVKPPTEVRLRLVDVDPTTATVGAPSEDGAPWIVAFVNVLEGRPKSQLIPFMSEFAEAIAQAYGVEVRYVRVLVHEYPKVLWGIGSQSAAALR